MLPQETRESTERDRQAFLLDQAASLHQSPFAILRKVPLAESKFVERNSSSLNFYLLFVATKPNNCSPQRFRPNEDEFYRVKHLPCGTSIRRFVHIHHYIGAVKGNDRWFVPCANQRQEVHRDVAEVNVQEA